MDASLDLNMGWHKTFEYIISYDILKTSKQFPRYAALSYLPKKSGGSIYSFLPLSVTFINCESNLDNNGW